MPDHYRIISSIFVVWQHREAHRNVCCTRIPSQSFWTVSVFWLQKPYRLHLGGGSVLGEMGTSSTFSVFSSISLLNTFLFTVKSKYTSVKSGLHCLLSEVCLAPAYSAVPLLFPVRLSQKNFRCQMLFLWVLAVLCASIFSPFFDLWSFFGDLILLSTQSDLFSEQHKTVSHSRNFGYSNFWYDQTSQSKMISVCEKLCSFECTILR